MIRNYFVLFVLSVVLCFVNGWRVFPLPDAPAPAPVNNVASVKPTPALPRLPTASSKDTTNYLVKPTPVLPRFPVAPTTANFSSNKFNILSTSVKPVLSTQDVSLPSTDLLPPKTEYVEYEP